MHIPVSERKLARQVELLLPNGAFQRRIASEEAAAYLEAGALALGRKRIIYKIRMPVPSVNILERSDRHLPRSADKLPVASPLIHRSETETNPPRVICYKLIGSLEYYIFLAPLLGCLATNKRKAVRTTA